ncbi:putative DD41D transposase [Trichonephila clavipes]|nr:putative DD41D transposase [Trichonephila clavipes]
MLLRPEMIVSMDELNLVQALQDVHKKEFQLERVRLQAFVAATDPGCKKNSLGPALREKLTVWCALWSGGIIGPYFFKNDEGHNVTVNGDRYRAMITNFFIPELNNHDVLELWFQQDGATCHTSRATIDLLKDVW